MSEDLDPPPAGTSTNESRDHQVDEPPNRRRWTWWLRVPAIALIGLLVADVAVLWFRLDRTGGTVAGSPPGGTTWLLIGSDQRGNTPDADLGRFGTEAEVPGSRADVIVALRVADDGSVSTLGIPRDLLLLRPNTGLDRLATTLKDGPDAVAEALCHSIGLGSNHLAMIEFDGLRSLVDLVGGIEITSDAKILDRGSGLLLRDGTNRMDGRMALAYVRARSIEVWDQNRWVPDAARSAERPERAIEVIRAIANGVDPQWTNPIALHRLAWVGTGAVVVDGDAGPLDLLNLAQAVAETDSIESTTLFSRPRVGPGSELVPINEVAPATLAQVDEFQGAGAPAACARPAMGDLPGQ